MVLERPAAAAECAHRLAADIGREWNNLTTSMTDILAWGPKRILIDAFFFVNIRKIRKRVEFRACVCVGCVKLDVSFRLDFIATMTCSVSPCKSIL